MLEVYRRDQRDHGQPFFTLRATVNSCLTPTACAALRRQSADGMLECLEAVQKKSVYT